MNEARLKLNPCLGVRWRDGAVVLKRDDWEREMQSRDPVLLQLLQGFAQPAYPSEVIERLTTTIFPSHKAESVGRLLAMLVGRGFVVPAHLPLNEVRRRVETRREGLESVVLCDNGLSALNCPREQLSPGCQSCKDGRWICLHPALDCPGHCTSCPMPDGVAAQLITAPGIEMLFRALQAKRDAITGLSISGGDLFGSGYETSLGIARRAQRELPELYVWGYTNGILATADRMQAMRDAGMQELRFNLEAVKWSDEMMRRIESEAAKIFPWITVEVTSVPENFHHLVEQEKLVRLEEIGVKQLNLHELRVPLPGECGPEDANATKTYYGKADLYEYPGGLGASRALLLAESRELSYDTIAFAEQRGLEIRINECSHESTDMQMSGRVAWGIDQIQNHILQLIRTHRRA